MVSYRKSDNSRMGGKMKAGKIDYKHTSHLSLHIGQVVHYWSVQQNLL